MNRRPEILAPCGNMKALKAAVAAGADACYLAGNSFGARAYADNFDNDELIGAIEYAHLHDVRIYLTVNTLVKNEEFHRLYELLVPLYVAGLDAVLVQDLGVFRFIRKHFPGLPIHTSTQMNIISPSAARLMKSLGASRIVAAREMKLDELIRIKTEADVEVEAFVHGAMCLCYSGRCLMSSMAGGRSGNRGSCAQPCRQKYDGDYKLSMRDLCMIRHIPELVEAGIDSLKIEGRMKNEYYVAATVRAYRDMCDDYIAGRYSEEKAMEYERMLLDIFNRGGFSTGYFFRDYHDKTWDSELIDDTKPGRRGVKVGEILSIRDGQIGFKALVDIYERDDLLIDDAVPISITSNKAASSGDYIQLNAPETKRLKKGTAVYRTRCVRLLDRVADIIDKPSRLPVEADFRIEAEEAISLHLRDKDRGIDVEVSGDIAQKAESKPVSDDTIREKISGFGDTEFELIRLGIENDGQSFVPLSRLKSIKRDALDELSRSITASYKRDAAEIEDNTEVGYSKEIVYSNRKVHISVSDRNQLDAVLGMDISPDYLYIDMGYGGFSAAEAGVAVDDILKKYGDNIKKVLALPFINRGEYDISSPSFVELISSCDGLYIRNIDDLASFIDGMDMYDIDHLILSNSLYSYNDQAVLYLKELLKDFRGDITFEASYELSFNDDSRISGRDNVIRPYYGRIPLMITAGLRDTAGEFESERGSIYIKRAGELCYNMILGSEPLSLHMYNDRIGNRLYSLTTETPEEIRDIFSDRPRYIEKKKYTTGHYEKGI